MASQTKKNQVKKMEQNDEEDTLLKEIDTDDIYDTMIQIKKNDFREMTYKIYIVTCVLILYLGFLFLNNYRLLCTTLIVIGILLLHFKYCTLLFIYKQLGICKNKKIID